MPYTPPSHSPSASKTPSPTISRSHSYIKNLQSQHHGNGSGLGPRPGLPRSHSSTSYLHKHRRSPSVTADPPLASGTQPDEASSQQGFRGPHSSVRQSPPPVNDLQIPTGAVVSPPDSAPNSSDDEEGSKRGRTVELENLAELQAAISVIEQHRESSPSGMEEAKKRARAALGLDIPLDGGRGQSSASPISATEPRKFSHSRSHTASEALDATRPLIDSSERSSDSDCEEERVKKPPMLRKKSGELVRPALRPSAAPKRRPSSMPGTPTFGKAVHFDQQLEHVRHFLQVDRPLAVSAGSSPVDLYDTDLEFPFDDRKSIDPPWEWEIKLPNFPLLTTGRGQQAIRVERVFLSADKKLLIGTVAVQNLAFQKFVTARFTFDYWKTTSEVSADFNNDVRVRHNDGCDRFNFNIKIAEQADLENRTLFFCVRYNVNGREFWDSNGQLNFQVDFTKKHLPQKGKQGMGGNASRSLGSLPRSRPSPPAAAARPRPKSTSFDDFSRGFEVDFQFPAPSAILDDKRLKFKNKSSDTGANRSGRSSDGGQAFSNRYDFGASLSAAIQNANTVLGERSGLSKPQPVSSAAAPPSGVTSSEKPGTLASAKPPLSSLAYNEIIDKYCFFGSGSKAIAQKAIGGQGDGTDERRSSITSTNDGSAETSPTASPAPEPEKGGFILGQSPRVSRSSSPASARSAFSSAGTPSFGYPYPTMEGGLFSGPHTPTAIRG